MRSASSAVTTALAGRTVVARDFIWFVVRNRSTGDDVTEGLWSDVGDVTAPVLNPDTGESEDRTFYGAGSLVSISDIPAVSNLTVQTVTVTLSQIDDHVNDLLRTYDAKQARVEVYRGLFDPESRTIVDPAVCRFVGFVDEITVVTPAENQVGTATLTCTSHTQELTRSNPDTRSDASQRLRLSTDDFFADAAVVGDWQHYWGSTSGQIDTKPSQARQGLLGWGNFLGFL